MCHVYGYERSQALHILKMELRSLTAEIDDGIAGYCDETAEHGHDNLFSSTYKQHQDSNINCHHNFVFYYQKFANFE